MAGDEYGTTVNVLGRGLERRLNRKIGSRDPNILCNKCDNGPLAVYDRYAAEFLRNAQLIPIEETGGQLWRIENVDQVKLKLFCISYVWRASITSLPEFNAVSLGPTHEAKIAAMLLSGDAGSPDDYGVSLARFASANMPLGGLLLPTPIRVLNRYLYYEASLPDLFKFAVKVDAQTHRALSEGALGAMPFVLVHNRGDFESSKDFRHMVEIVEKDVNNNNSSKLR